MRRVAFAVVAGSIAGLVLVAEPGRASLYSPEAPFAISTDEGKPVALPFEEFKRRLAELTNALAEPKPGEPPNDDRKKFLDRIAKQPAPTSAAAKKLSDSEAAALATDLMRIGQIDKALDLLGPRSRKSNYFVLCGLAHAHALRGEWVDALRSLDACRLDSEMPAEVKGVTKSQRDAWEKLDKTYLPYFCKIRNDEFLARNALPAADRKKADEEEGVLPLFPLPGEDGKPQAPVRFANDASVYEPGVLAAAEKAKLPPDAIAVVQQLMLWFPGDTRLYWLLGELYAADDDLNSAEVIFNECVGPRAQGNRKILMEHRAAVHAAAEARKPPPPPVDPPPPISMRTIMIYFGAVGVVALFALVRVLMRRSKSGDCGPVG